MLNVDSAVMTAERIAVAERPRSCLKVTVTCEAGGTFEFRGGGQFEVLRKARHGPCLILALFQK